MHVIKATNVNTALPQAVKLLQREGIIRKSRTGRILEVNAPVSTEYTNPWERVLVYPKRDANPFFHFFESLWILAGQNDVNFLTEFNPRMKEYSDDGSTFNAPYGYRLRNGLVTAQDQIARAIKILKTNPESRQCVLQIWDDSDLTKDTKDKACNMSVVFLVRRGYLTMTVYNRSNDMLWGAYGANVVQFSMLHEYVAEHSFLPMGSYWQVSNSFHIYLDGPGGDLWDRVSAEVKPYVRHDPYDMRFSNLKRIRADQGFDADLESFFIYYKTFGLETASQQRYISSYFKELVTPMLESWIGRRSENFLETSSTIKSDDWRFAVQQWLIKRNSK